jgi:thymidylate kinase
LIVEFAGLPRSGKSTCIDAARHYFSRHEITVKMAGEAIRFCPFGSQYRVEIACWAANYALNTVLEASLGASPETLTLQDRGLFDALAFLRLLWKESYISRDTLSCLEEYFADRRWTKRVDLVILFDVEPEVVLERDVARYIARHLHGEDLPGVITNESTLQALRDCYKEMQTAFEDRFNIRPVFTSLAKTTAIAEQVVQIIKEELVP